MYRLLCLAASLLITTIVVLPAGGGEPGIKVPDGFEVTKFAGDELAHDIFSITTDAAGRIAVSGPGYVKILEDRDGDGRADHAHQFAAIKTGAMGMYFDGPDLIYAGDNKVARLRDTDGDRVGDTEEVWTQLRNGEHGAHHIVKGPDGWFYLAAGNDAGVSRKHATTPGSPIKDPICGAILRFSPDGRESEIVADGFRNMCGLDFNSAGHLFTVDSDNERDQHLPWYCPTRLFDVAIGQSHGWLQTGFQQGWNRPQYFFDSVERLVEIGRGSPTGVVVYRHRAWPKRYRDGVFAACWSMGKIYYFPMMPHRSSYSSKLEVFLEGEGATGLAIVGMTIDPAGDMYFAVGGRKTQGSVYRIRYVGPRVEPTPEERKTDMESRAKSGDELYEVLAANQPLSSWSRARWEPAARTAGSTAFLRICQDAGVDFSMRMRAVDVLTELFNGVPAGESAEIIRELPRFTLPDRQLPNTAAYQFRARLIWSAARKWPAAEAFAMVKAALSEGDAIPRRAVCEALISLGAAEEYRLDCPDHFPGVQDGRVERQLRTAYQRHFDKKSLANCGHGNDPFGRPLSGLLEPSVEEALVTGIGGLDPLRHAIRAVGDAPNFDAKPELYVGYQSKNPQALTRATRQWRELLYHWYPRGISDQSREYARLLALLEIDHPEALHRVVQSIDAQTALEDDIHFLIVVSRLRATRTLEITQAVARALVLLHHKLAARDAIAGRNWPLRVGELFEELCKKDPTLANAMIEDEKFGLPEHALFVSKMTGQTQVRAARTLLAAVVKSEADWNTDLISTLAVLPAEELRPHLRIRFDEPALRDAIAMWLAAAPAGDSGAPKDDRVMLVEALASVQPNVVRAVAEGLAMLNEKATPAEIAEALRALRRQTLAPNETATREALVALLKKWTGQTITVTETQSSDLAAAYRPWFDWFAKEHAEEARKLTAFAGDLTSWQMRLATIDWSGGDAAAGKSVYEKRSCHRCHSGSGRLGPDLAGAATRFSRDDLFAAVVDPNREVAPLYQTTEVVTESGQVYNGLVVYESPDTTMLQTGPDTVVRVGGVRKDGMRKSNVSLMPVGLLNDSSDRELADLYAYLKTLAN